MSRDEPSPSARSSTLDEFTDRLAAPTPTPGGGAASARSGRHAAALLRMVTGITLGRADASGPPSEDARQAIEELRGIDEQADRLVHHFAALEQRDMDAFSRWLAAFRLPRTSDEERTRRAGALHEATVAATQAPLATMEAALELIELLRRAWTLGAMVRLRASSDIGCSTELARAALRAAEHTARSNLPALESTDEARELGRRVEELCERCDRDYALLRRRLIRDTE